MNKQDYIEMILSAVQDCDDLDLLDLVLRLFAVDSLDH